MNRNISVIVEYFPPRLGGDRRIYEIAKRLSNRYQINFMVVPPSYVLFIKKIDFSLPKERLMVNENLNGYILGLPKYIWQLWKNSFLLPFIILEFYVFFKVLKKLIECKTDVIIINNTSVYTGLIGTLCSMMLRKPLIVEFNDLESAYTAQLVKHKLNNRKIFSLIKRLLVLIEDFIIKSGRKVTTHTSFLINYAFQRKLRHDVILIPDGVDVGLFDPSKVSGEDVKKILNINSDTKLCVYAGRIDYSIGGLIIYQVAHSLQSYSEIKFLIIGEGDPKLLKKLKELSNVIYHGRVSEEEVPKYLATADVILVPYPDTLASHSVSPLKLFEGLAMGKPVIASAVNGIKDVIKNDFNGVLVSSDVKDWGSAIINLIENPELARYLGENGRKTVIEKYDWDILSESFDDVLESVFLGPY